MGRFHVVVTAPIHREALDLLRNEADVYVFEEPPVEDELIESVRDADAILVTLNVERVSRRVIESASKLRVIARHGVGYDNVDVDAATERGVWVTITPVLHETVADMAFAHILCLARNVCRASQHVKSRLWRIRDPFLFVGMDVWGKVIGIIGLGRIGSAIAKRSKGFSMKILYYDIVRKPQLEIEFEAEYRPLNDLLRESDFVVISCPLTEYTRGMIGEDELKLMKPTAILVNIARGPIVDHDALVKALREGWIAGAGLDVFWQEPLPLEDPLLDLDNVILTPHIASNTSECRRRMALTAVEDILRVLHGEPPRYPVNDITKKR
ncbi:MAG: D-glycerate dehydrogenase [Candidatus Bathyarchaeota archaeon]|nr:D-glycerate dehydrogenase [Candidatus Bathyarchaeota archaeon]